MISEEEYLKLKSRLENDSTHTRALMDAMENHLLASIGRLLFSFFLWLLEMILKASGILIWPLLGYLKAKGYINIDPEEVKKWLGY